MEIPPEGDRKFFPVRLYQDRFQGKRGPKFLPGFLPIQQRVASVGMINSLAQTMLKLGSPGVPDIYQGSELWELSLVDPDNRRPVDFPLRERLLADVSRGEADPGEMLEQWTDGRIKLFITTRTLQCRRDYPQLFIGGDYLPLAVESSVRAGAVGFVRTHGGGAVIVLAPRLCAGIIDPSRPLPLGGDSWKTSRVLLPDELRQRTFRNVFTGAEIRPTVANDSAWIFLGQAFEKLPVALLLAV